ncbi:MAG: hypothetical protein ACK40X_02675, partial [Armatimonadota bacterium]
GFGQGLLIFHSGGVAGMARLLIEGGFIGTICLIALQANIVRCLLRILCETSSEIRDISPFLTASYVSCFVTTFNYINVTDMWIWFVWGLPAVALWVDQQAIRDIPLREGIRILKSAGFRQVTWRPFFVPMEKRLPTWILKTMVGCEGIPLVRSIPLRWKFHCLLKGEP